MAEIKDGILGGVSGKIGNMVGYQWRGKNLLRTNPRSIKRKASPAQQLQREKFSLVSSFVNKVRDVVNLYSVELQINNKRLSGKEQLISLLMKQCVTVLAGTPYLVLDRILLAIGTLPAATEEQFQQQEQHTFLFTWDTRLSNILSQPDDQVTLLVYHDKLDEFYIFQKIGTRQEGQLLFSLPSHWGIERLHLWSIWESAEEKRNSTSQYHLFDSKPERTS
ncbi:DUF6266 family protein [Myroides sp. DF42-4-2]|uniref:DUF6266 family protein n=1 Tax=unclassified Myroides TaxID=2642485 RepID=UPI00257725EA|nr:DUF6266 family protein [Myroides sp. DF42-4-2]MDM1408072.1 hypothetical protein [Myroides sp. DF42-4-2]